MDVFWKYMYVQDSVKNNLSGVSQVLDIRQKATEVHLV